MAMKGRRVASHRFVGGWNGKGCRLREMSSNLIAKKRTTWLGMCQQLVRNKKYIFLPIPFSSCVDVGGLLCHSCAILYSIL